MQNIKTKTEKQILEPGLETVLINKTPVQGASLVYIIADEIGSLYRVILTEYDDGTGRVELTDPNGEKPAILFEAYKGGVNEGRAKAIELINKITMRQEATRRARA